MSDPREETPKVHDLSAKRQLKDEAEELLAPAGVFMAAVKAVRIKWFGELMDTSEPARIASLHARLQALDAIPQELMTAINDFKMATRQPRHG
jgi:hypothetical protein